MKQTYLTLIVLFSSLRLQAQGENNEWIFGNGAHLSFNKGWPEVIYDIPEIKTLEGSTSVCDARGNLLFYSDGLDVYDKTHKRMPNGDSLLGHKSSTSSAVAVPYPGNPQKYFLFCVDQNLSKHNQGVTYSIIDMRLNDGRGDVFIKNISLMGLTDEKIAVTRQCNPDHYWLVLHKAFTDSFMAFSITDRGIDPKPVLSLIPTSKTERPEIGYMKFSPSGLWLVNANTLAERLEIFRFDKRSGQISLFAADNTQYHRSHNKEEQTYYGVAFSPLEKYVYVSLLDSGEIFQYNLGLPQAVIFSSRKLVHRSGHASGALQLGKDRRIYAADGYDSYCLNRINHPDEPGNACRFEYAAVVFGLRYSRANIGLPTLIESGINYFNLGRDIIIHHSSTMKLDAGIPGCKYLWSTGETTQTIYIRDTGGIYWVNVYDPAACVYYTDSIRVLVYKNFSAKPSGLKDHYFCAASRTADIEFSNPDTAISYIWISDNPGLNLPEAGRGNLPAFYLPDLSVEQQFKILVYPVRNGFVGNRDSFWIVALSRPVPDKSHIRNFEYCSGAFVNEIRVKFRNALSIKWQTIINGGIPQDSGQSYIQSFKSKASEIARESLIRYTAANRNCISEPVYVSLNLLPTPERPDFSDLSLCTGKTYPPPYISNRSEKSRYYWKIQGSPNGYQAMQDKEFLYSLEPDPKAGIQESRVLVFAAIGNCLSETDTFRVTYRPGVKAAFEAKESDGDTAFYTAVCLFSNKSKGYDALRWILPDGSLSETEHAEMVLPSNKSLNVMLIADNRFACSDTARLKLYFPRYPMVLMPNVFSPNGDRHNEVLKPVCRGILAFELAIFNRWGEQVYTGNMESEGWNGTYLGRECADETYAWVLRARDYSGKAIENRGTLQLLR